MTEHRAFSIWIVSGAFLVLIGTLALYYGGPSLMGPGAMLLGGILFVLGIRNV